MPMIPIATKFKNAMIPFKALTFVFFCLVSIQAMAQTFTGPLEVCINLQNSYSYADDVVYTSVTWSVTGGGVIVSGTGLSRVIKWTSDGTVTVKMFNGSTVVSQDTKNITLNTSGTISGPTELCLGNSVSIIRSGQVGTYSWEVSTDGTSWTNLGSASALTHSPSVNSQYRLRTGCARFQYSNIVSVSVNQPTQVGNLVVSGGNSFCQNGTIYLAFSSNPVGTIQWESRYKDGAAGSWGSWGTFATTTVPSNSYSVTSGTTLDRFYEFRVTVQNGICSALTGNSVGASVNPVATVGTISVSQGTTFYGTTGPLNLSVSSSQGSLSYEYSLDGSNWFSTANPTAGLVQSQLFRAKVTSGTCATVYSSPVTVSVFPSPVITLNGPASIPIGVTTALSVQSSFALYQWVRNNVDISGATNNTYTVTEPGDYKVKVKGSVSSPEAIALPVTIGSSLLAQPQTINYKVVTNIFKKNFTTSSNFYSLQPNEVMQSIAYMDGYGRTVQKVAIGQSKAKMDIVQPYVYKDATADQFSYLGYAATMASGQYKQYAVRTSAGNYVGSNQQAFYQPGGLVAQDASPFSKTIVEASSLQRITEQGAPGTDWQPGSGHTIKQSLGVNHSAFTDPALKNIRRWTTAGPVGTYYADNQLLAVTATDENGNKVWTFTDKAGQTILKRVQLDETLEAVSTPFLDTYYVYDNRGNLALQVPPKTIAKLNGGTAWSTTLRDEWCFIYTYDERNRLVENKTPDAAPVYYVYDPLDRLILIQDGYLRPLNKWMFVKYDIKGRSVMTGLYLNTTHTTRATIQTNVANPLYASGVWYEERGTTLHGYSNLSFPTVNSNATALEILAIKYYETYDFDNNGTVVSYTPQSIPGEEAIQFRTFDLPTGSKRLVLGSTTWLYNYQFYDKYGHVIQTKSNSHLSATVDNINSYVYDFDGTLTYSKSIHNGPSGTVATLQKMEYDHAGRLQKLFHSINGATYVQVAEYVYNELGQVIDKKLHNTGGTNFLQSVDYRYTIGGLLRSINGSQLATNSDNDDTNDYFGMELVRNTSEPGMGNTPYFNGNISAMKWKLFGEVAGAKGQRSYKYVYDKSDKLKTATFQANDGTAWASEVNTLNETMSYDANGNIISLQRNQNLRGFGIVNNLPKVTSALEAIDNLTYTYASGSGNKLTKVEDAVAAGAVGDKGFKNAVNSTTEYAYTTNGSLATDDNKGISSVTYNILGKPATVTFTDGKTIANTYDAMGNKLKMVVTQGSATTTDYVGGFVYQNNALSFFGSPEGRVVKNGSVYEYQYSIADHQGNTRVVFSSVTPAAQPVFTNAETAGSFGNYTNISSLEVFDYTDAGTVNQKSQKLTGAPSSMVGLSKSYKVYPGDKVKAEVYAKYWHPVSNTSDLPNFAAMLTSAFGVSSASTGEALKAFNSLSSYGGLVAAGTAHDNNAGEPKAFVTILLFDKNYKLLDAAWDQIDDTFTQSDNIAVKDAFDFLTKEITIKEEGFAYVYLSNESPTGVDVYFDDLTVTYTPTNIVQYNEYYPFGLQTANSWTRENAIGNNFLYNSGSELNNSSSTYEMMFREYDPALGRMNQVDPMASKYGSLTPYNYSFNSPVLFNDPNGADPDSDYSRWPSMQGPQDASVGPDNGGNMYGSAFVRYGTGFNYGRNYYDDAQAVRDGKMTHEEYGSNYGYTWSNMEVSGHWRTNDATTGVVEDGVFTIIAKPDVFVLDITTQILVQQTKGSGYSWLGAAINASSQVYGLGDDLLLRKSLYHDPYMNDLFSSRTNAEIAYRRNENLAYSRSRMSPLGRSISNWKKPIQTSLSITQKIATGQKTLGLPNTAFSGMISGANVVRGLGIVGFAASGYISVDRVISSNYDTGVITSEVTGWGSALMLGSMGATYGSALGPLGTLFGGVIGGTIGYYYGSGQGF